MKHKRFEENILVDEAYTNYGKVDKNEDQKKGVGIAKHFAESLEYGERKKWFHQIPEEPTASKTLSQDQIEELRKEASSALHGDTLAYETKSNRSGSSDQQWARTLLNKGAIGDRVAAATILIQDNPIYNLTALRNLVNNVKPAKKKDGIVIIDALSELFVSELLLPDLKLRKFEQHSLGHVDEMASGNKQTRRNILKLWYFEDQLKELYGCKTHHHLKMLKLMLLTNIINKLGDPSQAVASKVIYHLCQLLFNHPNMKAVVLADIEKMLFRTNISPRAQYYGICFLNQFFLGKDDSKIAENLIRIYFSFFKASIKKGDIDSRLMSAILTGVKRAYPFADRQRLAIAEHVSAVHRLVHLAGLSVSVHALALLFHISDASEGTADRYYTALYRKLTNAEIFNTSHSALLFSLIYKSLKQDKNIDRVTSFIKRLLQLCCYMTPAQSCGMLFLVSQVLKDGVKKDAIKLVWSKRDFKEEIKDEETKTEEEGTNTEDTITEEQNETEVNDTINDTIDSTEDNNEVKIESKKIDLLRGDKKDLLLDDDEEMYVDLKMDDEGNIKPKKRRAAAVTAGWFHARVKSEEDAEDKEGKKKEAADKEIIAKIQLTKAANTDRVISEYNPYARNPAFAGATCSVYFELLPLFKHFHPTVKLFAEKLLNEQIVQYSGDPLKDFAGIRFLDRFVFKNPKKRETQQYGEVKKVKGSHPKFAIRKNYSAKGLKAIPVNSSTYLNEDAKKIPVDEKFLYDFLQKRREAKTSDDEDSDADSVTSEDFNKYLDSVTGNRRQDSDDELDYLAEMEASKQKQGSKKKDDSDDQLDDDDDGENDGNDFDDDVDEDEGELNISGDEDEPDLSADEDELRLEGSDDDFSDGIDKKSSKNKPKMKLKGKDDLGSLFASAEEFSTLLEETATNKGQGSSQAVSNTDNASTKQLAWEQKRDTWIKGYNRKILGNKKHGKKKFKNGRDFKIAEKGAKRKGGNDGGAGGKRKKK
ncbi:PREDICTED: CCAAT/enhancer-binding protein zeta [Papilio polytes]|uniref:CCAAT/enhancer-binding protein zeta n=1 Tax=Papilio polytes TaxID=76194 RepID=UPI000675C0FC|nr:PREDICTED: CCAAT/enhancer-binding protein zeta [Papilio polytes]